MKKYFYHDGSKENGPFTLEELRLVNLKQETPIWYDGLANWTKVQNLEELQFLFPPKIAPPPLIPPIAGYNNNSNQSQDNPKQNKKLTYIIISVVAILLLGGIITWSILKNENKDDYSEAIEKYSSNDNTTNTESKSNSIAQEIQNQNELKEQKEQAEKAKINAKLTQKYMGYRNNWRSYITASSNQYMYSEMGGISNLEAIVSNQTDKKIDEVQIRIDYIKANGGTWKSETVSVTNISPNSTKSVSAPSSERGTSVNMEIENISAPTFHFCYPNGNGESDTDPYFCK
jgi:hypothetical protein